MSGGIDTGGGGFKNSSSAATGDFTAGQSGSGNTYNFGAPPVRLGSSQISSSALMMLGGAVLVVILLLKKGK